jgi:hypothetical protein
LLNLSFFIVLKDVEGKNVTSDFEKSWVMF